MQQVDHTIFVKVVCKVVPMMQVQANADTFNISLFQSTGNSAPSINI
jgi:hypothetical protein